MPASQQAARQRMAALWVAWLLGSLAVPLLRAHFFATETAAYRLQIFYYRSRPPSRRRIAYSQRKTHWHLDACPGSVQMNAAGM